jgi:hypothetical protein
MRMGVGDRCEEIREGPMGLGGKGGSGVNNCHDQQWGACLGGVSRKHVEMHSF